MGDQRLIDAVTDAGLTSVLELFHQKLDATDHGIYEVRRVAPTRGWRAAYRPIRASTVRSSNRAKIAAALGAMPGRAVTGPDGTTRMMLRDRGSTAP